MENQHFQIPSDRPIQRPCSARTDTGCESWALNVDAERRRVQAYEMEFCRRNFLDFMLSGREDLSGQWSVW